LLTCSCGRNVSGATPLGSMTAVESHSSLASFVPIAFTALLKDGIFPC
jgi:hypothetical protein